MFHVERGVCMNSVEVKFALERDLITKVEIVPALDAPVWIVVWFPREEPCRYMTKARGGSCRFKTIDAAHTAIRRVGWTGEVQLTV